MFGIDDPYIWLAYILCIASTVACVIYGLLNWNQGEEDLQIDDILWIDEERKLEEEFE